MKTAMQELIYDLKLLQEKDDVKLVNIESIISYANDKLEKEKEQIIEAFEQGLEFGFPTNGSNYFNKTYNQNK